MKTKNKDKKVSPSVYFLVPIAICLIMLGLYTFDTFYTISKVSNMTLESSTSKYGKLITIKNYREDDILDESKYIFYSETPEIQAITTPEEEQVEEVVTTPVVTNAYVPEINTSAELEALVSANGMTVEEFYVVCAIVASEGGGSYTDAYAVANAIYNRTLSSRWSGYAYSLGLNGSTMYGQAIVPSQFTVYQSGSYLNHMYEVGTNAYNAVYTLLSTKEMMHNFMSFRSASSGIEGTQFIEGGNIYISPLD